MIQAFREGSIPDNKQIDEALLYAEKHSFLDLKELSPDGQKVRPPSPLPISPRP